MALTSRDWYWLSVMLIVLAPSKVDPVRVMVTQPQAYSYAVLITTLNFLH